MELDELKNLLNQADPRNIHDARKISLKTGRPYDPFQQIKKRCVWILMFFSATTVIFSPFLLEDKNRLYLILYLVLSIESLIALTGYWQIKSMEQAGGNIKQNLVARIRHLHSIFRSYIFLNAFSYILLVFVLEYMIRDHITSEFGIEKIVFPIRLVIYLAFIVFQYLQKRWSFQKNYGSYLSSMIHLLNQTHEK